jgi:hypothetical protein
VADEILDKANRYSTVGARKLEHKRETIRKDTPPNAGKKTAAAE